MKPSEIIAMLMIAAVLFIVVLICTTAYAYFKEGELQWVQLALAAMVAVVTALVGALRRQIKKAERLVREQLEDRR